ncbi:LamG-like jellyroll fold domain-containing protein [Nitrososphaera sp.]|uniref:LamG-like jellyroll fold domain-containing protein n=1 Tax=Nitrososphaera sp. TaxID=1971748 RepID=UPI00182B5BAC|nr:LamG-like jellyroll fold domain-containing protein [Nitrososphaera sp.]NWG36482.1 hypothetical protein [Nitrososphaera sp.]
MARKFAISIAIVLIVGAILPSLPQNAFATPPAIIILPSLPQNAFDNLTPNTIQDLYESSLSDGDIIFVDKNEAEVKLPIIVYPASSVTMSQFPGAKLEARPGAYPVSVGVFQFSWLVDNVVISDPNTPAMYGVTFTAKNGNEVAAKSILIGVESNLRAALSLDRTGYSAGENATITVRDPHANRNAFAVDTTVAEVRFHGPGTQWESVTLTESPDDPDVFVGKFTVGNANRLFVRYGNADPVDAEIGRFIAFDQSVYHVGESAKITLRDDRVNQRLAEVDTIQVTVSSGTQSIQVPLSETNISSGVFEGYVRLGSGSDVSIPLLQVLQNTGAISDRLVVTLGDHVARASVIEPRFEVNHSISATRDTDLATITLADKSRNLDSNARDTVEVTVSSGGSSIVNRLVETGRDTGVFWSANKIVLTSDHALASGSPQHSLVVQGNVIDASYPSIPSSPGNSASFPVQVEPAPVVPDRLRGIGTDGSSPFPGEPIFPGIVLIECSQIDLDGDGLPDGDGDLDGDGLCDSWEPGSGPLRIQYPYGGATHTFHSSCTPECPSRYTKDVFVEIDYDPNYAPNQLALNYVMDRFNLAPVENPESSGIKLHNILSDPLEPQDVRELTYIWTKHEEPGVQDPADSYTEIKSKYFGISHPNPAVKFHLSGEPEKTMAWANAVHYSLWINKQQHAQGSSGIAEVVGNDIIVSLGSFTPYPIAVDKQQGTYMHELGHNLGLGHGGALVHTDNSINCKPNYLSLMSYSRQMTTYTGNNQDYSRENWPASLSLNVGNLDEHVPSGTALPYEQIVYGVGPITPTSQYTFDNNANDVVSSNNLDLRGNPTPAFGSSGPYGSYIMFDGLTQSAQATNNSVYDVAMQDFWMAGMFYKTGDNPGDELIVHKAATNEGSYALFINPSNILRAVISDGTLEIQTGGTTISPNAWYIWGVSYERGSRMTLYLYNVSTSTLTADSAYIWLVRSATNSGKFTVASTSATPGSFFPGYMDNLIPPQMDSKLSLNRFYRLISQFIFGTENTYIPVPIDPSTTWIDWNGNDVPDVAANDITDIGIQGCTPSSNQFDRAIPLRDHNDWRDIVASLNFRSANPAAVSTGSAILTHGLAINDLVDFRKNGIYAIDAAIQNIGNSYFNGSAEIIKANYRKDLLAGGGSVLSFVSSGDIQKAVAKLETIRETMDGRAGGNPAGDKIKVSAQNLVLPILDNNIAALKLELDAPYKAPHTFQVKSYSGSKVYTITGNSTTITSAVNTFTFNNATKTIDLDFIGSGDVLLEIPSELVTTVTDVSRAGQEIAFTYTSPSPTVKVLIKDLPYYARSTTVNGGGVVQPKSPLDVSPTQDVGPAGEVTVKVSDCDVNASPSLRDTVTGKVEVDTDRGSSADLTVTETGANTCVFIGTITLNPDSHAGSQGSGTGHATINVIPGDIVSVRYEYVEAGTNTVAARVFEVESEDPTMETGATIYTAGDIIGLTVTDFDANTDPALFDSIEVRVTSDSDAVGFDVMAVETGRDSGRFTAAVPTSTSSSSGSITVKTGDKVYFEYTDRFSADYADRLGNLADPSEDFVLEVQIAPDGITSTTPSAPQPEDLTGNPLNEILVGTQVVISSTITNNASVAQPFAAVVEVKDADGFTIFLSWQTGILPASGHTDVGLSWTPAAPGDYTVKVFVIDSIASTSPTVLSPIAQSTFTVSAAVPMNLPPMSPPSGTIVEP